LPHPTACEDSNPVTTCPDGALMWTGYASYPTAFYTQEDQETLGMSPFLGAVPVSATPLFECDTVQFEGCEVIADYNGDWNVDLQDYFEFSACLSQFPLQAAAIETETAGVVDRCLAVFDFNRTGTIDLADFAEFQRLFFTLE